MSLRCSTVLLDALRCLSLASRPESGRALRCIGTDTATVLRGDGISQLSATYEASQAAMNQLLAHLEQLTTVACKGGGEAAVKRHKDRGKLPPRDRIAQILDTGSPFLELSQLAGHGLYGECIPHHQPGNLPVCSRSPTSCRR